MSAEDSATPSRETQQDDYKLSSSPCRGKTREDLGQLTKSHEASIIANDDGAYPTMAKRTVWVDETNQEWVKLNRKYWKYPSQIDH